MGSKLSINREYAIQSRNQGAALRISELSERSGVPLSTVKFYLREEILSSGEVSSPNQAQYDESHLGRLALIRALREVAGLSLEAVRDVLAQVESPWEKADPVGSALAEVYPAPDRKFSSVEQKEYEIVLREVEELMTSLEWIHPDSKNRPRHLHIAFLADAVMQLRKHIDPAYPVSRLRDFATVVWELSAVAYRGFDGRNPEPGDDLTEATRFGLLGILLVEPIVGALLRSALVMRSLGVDEST